MLFATGMLQPHSDSTALAASRQRLMELLVAQLSERLLSSTTIVFDAKDAPKHLPAELQYRGMRILFARDHREADDLLEELMEREPQPQSLRLISSDRRLQKAAKRRRIVIDECMDWYERVRDGDAETCGKSARQRQRASGAESIEEPSIAFDDHDLNEWYAAFGLIDPLPQPKGREIERTKSVAAHDDAAKLDRKSKPAKASTRTSKPKLEKPNESRRRSPEARRNAKRNLAGDVDKMLLKESDPEELAGNE